MSVLYTQMDVPIPARSVGLERHIWDRPSVPGHTDIGERKRVDIGRVGSPHHLRLISNCQNAIMLYNKNSKKNDNSQYQYEQSI